ncbi:MAG: hypothetical protein Q4B26_07080 [Eubacteriales bacterium]|nr:hypothetical protein [Eubacteriales bacterium]
MGEFRCGAAKRCITPPENMLTVLRGLKHYPFAGVMDDIYVRIALFETDEERILLVDYDLNTAPCDEELLDLLSRQTGTPIDGIFLFATHTHSVPVHSLSLERVEELDNETIRETEKFTRYLKEQTLQAAREALLKMEPARIGFAEGESSVNIVRLQDYLYRDKQGEDFVVCNLGADPMRTPDRRLCVLRVDNLNGDPILLHINYPMHCVASIWNDFDGNGAMGISGDIAGGIERQLENDYKGAIAMWSSAAAGDLNPIYLNEMISPEPVTGRTIEWKPIGKGFAQNCLKLMVERHYGDICRVMRQIHYDDNDIQLNAVSDWSITPGVECIRQHNAAPVFLEGEEIPEHTVYLQLARIGKLYLMGVGAELYSSLGKAMMDKIPGRGVLITHSGSTLGKCHYILDDETIDRCDASRGYAMVPGYDEYRCRRGIMLKDLCFHVEQMLRRLDD